MKLLILGAGGVGGYFGARLAESGADVTFLVRPERRAQLERDGLRVDSPLGNVRMPVKTAVASELTPDYDLALLTCKAYDLDSAMESLAPAMAGRCTVLPLLNGIAHLTRLDQRYGVEHVLGGTCTVNVTLLPDGTIRHEGTLQRMVLGERGRPSHGRTEAFAAVLATTRLDWEVSPDVEQDLWEKLVTLSSLAAVTCLFRASVGEIMRAEGGPAAIERALSTNLDIAAREHHAPRPAAIEFARRMLLDRSSSLTASMYRDLERGAPVESDHIIGWMLEKARAHGLDATILALAYTHLRAYENRRGTRQRA